MRSRRPSASVLIAVSSFLPLLVAVAVHASSSSLCCGASASSAAFVSSSSYPCSPPRSIRSFVVDVDVTTTTTALHAKKKKKKAGGGGGGGSKVQVKLVKHVEGTGHIGDVVMVAPAFFENKLRRSGSAVLISDDEVSREREERERAERETRTEAERIRDKIEDDGPEGVGELRFEMKAGPDGHLFGGVNYKAVLTELGKKFPKGTLERGVKVETVKDGEGRTVRHDIKELGGYTARVSLLKDVSAEVKISVVEEN